MIGFSEIREDSQEAQDDYSCEQSDRIRELEDEVNALTDERDCLQTELDELKYVKTAAAALLENYSSWHPSAGEVDALAEDITQLLTEKYHISRGII